MTISREESVRELGRLNQQLQVLLAQVPEGAWDVPGTIGGGDWSVRDLVGHVASWERLALEAIASAGTAGPLALPTEELDELNAKMLEQDRTLGLPDLRQRAQDTHARLLSEIEGLDDRTWETELLVGPGEAQKLGELVGSLTGAEDHPCGHLQAHLPDLQAYVETVTQS